MTNNFQKHIEKAANVVGHTWPLYSFVTSNPLSGYEQKHFQEATGTAADLLGSKIFPEAKIYEKAWKQGDIDNEILMQLLEENKLFGSAESYLQEMAASEENILEKTNQNLNRIMVKWLSIFMDEGLAEWEMPKKELGFFSAWRNLAKYDSELTIDFPETIPKNSTEVFNHILGEFSENQLLEIFEYHLAALPGWTGYIKHRQENNTAWQQSYPITLEEYLAVRLYVANNIDALITPPKVDASFDENTRAIQYVWLKAWEKTWQINFANKLLIETKANTNSTSSKILPDAQLVFCIDTRSELIRRNVEAQGNFETFGYAGFFGIAMDYKNLNDGILRKSCPPIVGSAYNVSEVSLPQKQNSFKAYEKRVERKKFTNYFLTRMKNMLPSAFGYVEGSGVIYGFSLLSRTLFPKALYNPERKNLVSHENTCEPQINYAAETEVSNKTIAIEEKTAIVKSAFDLLGWQTFSPLVLFVGHGSHSANNPFASSLDCGACAASPGRHNARMLAKMANLPAVRENLKSNFGIIIPEDTHFIGAEHNTTTDEIVIFDNEVPSSHKKALLKLRQDLINAQKSATNERLGGTIKSVSIAHKKTNNWAETRPEWGLAKNAGFVVGPRDLTRNLNMDGNCFLHSYNWELDRDGKALEGIMQGPMTVTQWINNHYYFVTVDNEKFGGGSKITHNITGRFGVVQGNGGDLKTGLPLQSVNATDSDLYHKPLRLSVYIQAPTQRIQEILYRNPSLQSLLDNEWIYLFVIDPTKDNSILRYENQAELTPNPKRKMAESI